MNYIVATIGLDKSSIWTVSYYGDVPEQGGLELKRGQLSFTTLEGALTFLDRELRKQSGMYEKKIREMNSK